MRKDGKKIVLTGGHAATTALATIEFLKKEKGYWEMCWIGSRLAVEGKNSLTLEFREFPKLGIKCFNIITGRLQRKWTRYSIWSIIKIPIGFLHALYLLIKIKPDIIISFGGFAAFPVVVVGWVLRIPVIIHEQTIAAGLANRYSAFFSTKIALARNESRKYFPKNKIVLTGNPVRSAFYKIKPKRKSSPEVILATGGSRGSQNLNKHLISVLPELLQQFELIHQCGELDYEDCIKAKNNLPKNLAKKYEVFSSIPVNSMAKYFEKADIILGRAGANTVSEVIASRTPSIFMPIPWSQHDEQKKNALIAEKAGLSLVIEQNGTTKELFLSYILKVEKNWQKMLKAGDNEIYQLDKNAAQKLADLAREIAK